MRLFEFIRKRRSRSAAEEPPAAAGVADLSPAGALDDEMLKRMVRDIALTEPREIGCDTCFDQIDEYIELILAGRNVSEAMPLVQHHLLMCKDCRDEFEALLLAVRQMDQ